MAWMMPLSHSTSDGQLEDLDGPSDLRPMMAPSSQFLRNLRYAVRVPPLSFGYFVWPEARNAACLPAEQRAEQKRAEKKARVAT